MNDSISESLVYYNFFEIYKRFEKTLLDIFNNSINNFDDVTIKELFYYTGWFYCENDYIKYDDDAIRLDYHKFEEDSAMKLGLNRLLRLCKQDSNYVVPAFSKDIDFIQTKMENYKILDGALKVLNMRNRIAHQPDATHLDLDKFYIELLSDDNFDRLRPNWAEQVDFNNLPHNFKLMACNCIHMERMLSELANSKFEEIDNG